MFQLLRGTSDQVIDGVNVYSVPFQNGEGDVTFHNSKSLKSTIVTNIGILKRVVKLKPQVGHFHDPDFIFSAIFLSILGKKVVYDVHEDVPNQILAKNWIPKTFRKSISIIFSLIEFISSRFFFTLIIAATPTIGLRFPPKKL